MAIDIYQIVTDRIISELEKGSIPWKQPWLSTACCVSHVTGKRYSLLNQLMLGRPGEYLTFKQAADEGGHVRKGEKSSMVIFWKWLDKKDENGQLVIGDNGKPEQIGYLRYYSVFHIDQCEGITPRFTVEPQENLLQPDEQAEKIISGYVARSGIHMIIEESNQAFYRPSTDTVVLPQLSQYTEVSEYYSTAFHELTHSTGHVSRLNRLDTPAAFGSDSYSKEELIAELGASTLVHTCGLETPSSFRNNAAYIQNWLHVLQDDKKLLISAASKAEKAVRLILGEEESVRTASSTSPA